MSTEVPLVVECMPLVYWPQKPKRGRANKAISNRNVPWKNVKNPDPSADGNKWSDSKLSGIEKADYFLKHFVCPEKRRIPNQVTIEEVSAKSDRAE